MLPIYLQYLGAEAYGLVGFFAVMQAWLNLLDVGLSPTLSRQMAHDRGHGGLGLTRARQLLRSIEILFLMLGVLIGLSIWLSSSWIADHWLDVRSLSHAEVAYCISLMGVIIAIRWFASLYRSGIQGLECQVWLNSTNIILATLRYVGVWIMLKWIAQDATAFFEFQFYVSVIELLVLAYKLYRNLPSSNRPIFELSLPSLKSVLPFAGSVAYTTSLWIVLTQVDKLILSHVLPLKEYGYFALTVVVANGILSCSGPISQALLPRMTFLLSQGKEDAMLDLYRKASALTIGLMAPLTGTIALFSEELLFAWTGDRAASHWAAPVLVWFSLGNGILAVGAFQYYLQYAHGKMKLHVLISTVNALIQVPILAYAAINYGALGAAVSSFVIRLICFFIWTFVIHRSFAPGLHWKWLSNDIAPLALTTCLSLAVLSVFKSAIHGLGRVETIAVVVAMGLTVLVVNFLFFLSKNILAPLTKAGIN